MPLTNKEYTRMQELRARLNGQGITDQELRELQGLINRYKWLEPKPLCTA